VACKTPKKDKKRKKKKEKRGWRYRAVENQACERLNAADGF